MPQPSHKALLRVFLLGNRFLLGFFLKVSFSVTGSLLRDFVFGKRHSLGFEFSVKGSCRVHSLGFSLSVKLHAVFLAGFTP